MPRQTTQEHGTDADSKADNGFLEDDRRGGAGAPGPRHERRPGPADPLLPLGLLRRQARVLLARPHHEGHLAGRRRARQGRWWRRGSQGRRRELALWTHR